METKTAESYGYQLLKQLPKGTILFTLLRHVSRSGMTRVFDVKLIQDNTILNVIIREFPYCAKNCEQESRWGGNYKVTGCGMDMGFWLVYELSYLTHQDGYYFNHRHL